MNDDYVAGKGFRFVLVCWPRSRWANWLLYGGGHRWRGRLSWQGLGDWAFGVRSDQDPYTDRYRLVLDLGPIAILLRKDAA